MWSSTTCGVGVGEVGVVVGVGYTNGRQMLCLTHRNKNQEAFISIKKQLFELDK